MISLAIPSHNEHLKGNFGWLRECLEAVRGVSLITEIVISDDASDDYHGFLSQGFQLEDPRIKYHRNKKNLGVFGNKVTAISRCTNPWVQLCDSDDAMDADHFARLESLQPWSADTLYANSWGKPKFTYQSLIGDYDASSYMKLVDRNDPWQPCQINTGNHFLNQNCFVNLLRPHVDSGIQASYPALFDYATQNPGYWRRVFDGADSAFYNTRWLLSGGRLRVVEGLEYTHRYNATATGAYHSSPKEKEVLPGVYLDELRSHTGTDKV